MGRAKLKHDRAEFITGQSGAANPGCRRLSGGATHWKAGSQASSFFTLFREIPRAEGPLPQSTKTVACPTFGAGS
jgi:hypothetical protein